MTGVYVVLGITLAVIVIRSMATSGPDARVVTFLIAGAVLVGGLVFVGINDLISLIPEGSSSAAPDTSDTSGADHHLWPEFWYMRNSP